MMPGVWRALRPLLLLLFVLAGLAAWGFLIEPGRLVVRTEALSVPGLPPIRVAVFSDLHAGSPFIDEAKIRRLVAEVNAGRPDLVLLLGDYVIGDGHGHKVLGGKKMEPPMIASLLRGLHAPRGVYAVLGNHDWWTDGPAMRRALEGAGIRVLDDEALLLDAPGPPLWLLGLADAVSARPHPAKVVRGIPAGAPVLAFTHSPDVFPSVPSRVALTLAGHTHGGQVRLPFLGPVLLPSRYGHRYASGLVSENDHQLFVTTGIGTSILPVRFLVPPELVFLEVNQPPPK